MEEEENREKISSFLCQCREITSRTGLVLDAAANIRAQREEQVVSLQRSETEDGTSPRFAKGVNLQQALEYAITNAELAGNQGTCTACVVRSTTYRRAS